MNRSLVTRLPRLAAVFETELQAMAALDRFGSAMMPRSENAELDVIWAQYGWMVCVVLTGSHIGRTYWLADKAVAAIAELERPGGCGAARNPIQAGTVSHGTLRTEDLIEAFAAELERHRVTDSQLLKEAQRYLDGCPVSDNEACEILDALFDALNDSAPEGMYFGAHESDGSDFGFWHVDDDAPEFDIYPVTQPGGCGAARNPIRFKKFFSIDDGKAVKAQKNAKGWLNAINYMAPHASAGVGNLCPHASAGCRALCLGTESGQAAMRREGEDNSVTRSRKAKAVYYMRERRAFLAELVHHISRALARADAEKRRLCVRLNGSTDIAWESAAVGGVRIMDIFHDVQFVDYTKSVKRMMRFCRGELPANYHLTFSRSEDNEAECEQVLHAGGNVAVVFASVPITWKGWPVVDGDKHDLRHLDSTPVSWSGGAVIGLLPKGNKAKRDQSGFVVR